MKLSDQIQELKSLTESLQAQVEFQKEMGFQPMVPNSRTRTNSPSISSVPAKKQALEALQREMENCRVCPLSETRTKLVFGSGNPEAGLVFVGEAPGFDEDRQGLPFVGKAGQLLTKIIGAMKLQREEVYICNILKCRPPGNRNPSPTEIRCCEPFLVRQLEIIRPRVICALGGFAAKTLLKTDQSISRLRGGFHDYHGIKLMPTFHPAYLLRNPQEKRKVWEDIKNIMVELGIGNPP